MKKIFILLLACFYMTNVSALEYSAYSEFSDYIDEEVTSDEFTDVKKERRYKYYKLDREYGSYESLDINNSDYPFVDYDDFEYTLDSSYSVTKPLEKEGRVISEVKGYHYKKVKDISYIEIGDFNNRGDFNISNLLVMYQGKKVDYNISYVNATSDTINKSGYIRLNFNEKLKLKDLKISFDVNSNVADAIVSVVCGDDTKICYNNYLFTNNKKISWYPEYVGVVEDGYSDDYVPEGEYVPSSLYTKLQGEVTLYTYKDILYHKYNLVRNYYDEYLTDSYGEYNNKDEDDYRDYYAYRTRTLLEENKVDKPIIKLLSNNVFDSGAGELKVLGEAQVFDVSNNSNDSFDYPNSFDSPVKGFVKYDKGLAKESNHLSLWTIPLFLLLISILILLLSKRYKKEK